MDPAGEHCCKDVHVTTPGLQAGHRLASIDYTGGLLGLGGHHFCNVCMTSLKSADLGYVHTVAFTGNLRRGFFSAAD